MDGVDKATYFYSCTLSQLRYSFIRQLVALNLCTSLNLVIQLLSFLKLKFNSKMISSATEKSNILRKVKRGFTKRKLHLFFLMHALNLISQAYSLLQQCSHATAFTGYNEKRCAGAIQCSVVTLVPRFWYSKARSHRKKEKKKKRKSHNPMT